MSCESVGEKPRPAQLAAIRRIVRDVRWLVGRAPEDGAAQTTAQNLTQVLKHKCVGFSGEEVSRPEPLTLLRSSFGRLMTFRGVFTSFRYILVAQVDDFLQADSGRHAGRREHWRATIS